MKYFIAIVIGLVGLGVFLRFHNDASLKEKVEVTMNENSNSSGHTTRRPSNKNNQQWQSSTQNSQNNVQAPNENEASSYSQSESDMLYNEGLIATCPYTDANGFCASEPLVTSEEIYPEDQLQAQTQVNTPDPEEGLMIPDDVEYEKYLNDQTFDSIRTPASEE
jgi:hypothetical protein